MSTRRTFEALNHTGRVPLIPATRVVGRRTWLLREGGQIGKTRGRQVQGRNGLRDHERAVAIKFFFKATAGFHLLYRFIGPGV
jgi:hypothetical protein